jgi:hypothetical protein
VPSRGALTTTRAPHEATPRERHQEFESPSLRPGEDRVAGGEERGFRTRRFCRAGVDEVSKQVILAPYRRACSAGSGSTWCCHAFHHTIGRTPAATVLLKAPFQQSPGRRANRRWPSALVAPSSRSTSRWRNEVRQRHVTFEAVSELAIKSRDRYPEFASQRTGTRHAPRTMRLLLWSHACLIESRNRDDGGLARYGTSTGNLRVMRLRPFPEPARRTTHRDTHAWHPFLNFRQ